MYNKWKECSQNSGGEHMVRAWELGKNSNNISGLATQVWNGIHIKSLKVQAERHCCTVVSHVGCEIQWPFLAFTFPSWVILGKLLDILVLQFPCLLNRSDKMVPTFN